PQNILAIPIPLPAREEQGDQPAQKSAQDHAAAVSLQLVEYLDKHGSAPSGPLPKWVGAWVHAHRRLARIKKLLSLESKALRKCQEHPLSFGLSSWMRTMFLEPSAVAMFWNSRLSFQVFADLRSPAFSVRAVHSAVAS